MATKCFSPLLGKMIRVTRLDECGSPPPPGTPDAYLATDGFITVTLSSETEDGVEILTKKANGDICVNEKFANSFKRFTVEINFCGVNPALFGMITNGVPYLDYCGDLAGFKVPEGAIDSKFALELWTGMSGLACVPGQETASGYILLPFLNAGVLGDLEINGTDALNFTMTGAYSKGQNMWGVGPYDVVNQCVPETQSLSDTGATDGTFTLTVTQGTTGPIAFDATAAEVQSALDAVGSNATASGGPLPGSPITLSFPGSAQNTTADSTDLVGGVASVTTTTQGGAGAPAPLPTPLDPYDHLLLVDTGVAPPPSSCDPQPMPG